MLLECFYGAKVQPRRRFYFICFVSSFPSPYYVLPSYVLLLVILVLIYYSPRRNYSRNIINNPNCYSLFVTTATMKFSTVLPVVATLIGSAQASGSAECREKTSTCQNRVEVLVTDLVYGLMDDAPAEVYEAFVAASTKCLSCVENNEVEVLSSTADESKLSANQCKWAGCWCCTRDWCQRDDGTNYCPEQCHDLYGECAVTQRRLTGEDDGNNPYFVNYEMNVCMDDVTPLNPSATNYVDHSQMLADFESELATCYADRGGFLDTWSSLCADSGIDLSLMARDDKGTETIMFGATGLDSAGARVTTYTSDESHRSTSHMIFYSALGFVTVSAFAVMGTAVVIKMLNKRQEEEQEQAAKWVAEMANEETVNPLSATEL
jgi:hypothetical protein